MKSTSVYESTHVNKYHSSSIINLFSKACTGITYTYKYRSS